jgi:hypothetical protein
MVVITKVRRANSRNITVALSAFVVLTVYITYRVSYLPSKENNSNHHQNSDPTKVVLHPSLCQEGPTTNMRKTSLFQAKKRRGDYTQYHHISQIVEGPALQDNNNKEAVCKVRSITHWFHFPHTYVP